MIGLWKNKSGIYNSHNKGLTKEQIEFLRALKEGDKLVLFINDESAEHPNRAHATLKKSKDVQNEEI